MKFAKSTLESGRLAQGLLILIGLLQPIGYLTGAPRIREFGKWLGLSPLALVFTGIGGSEMFATDYSVEWIQNDGKRTHMNLAKRLAITRGPLSYRAMKSYPIMFYRTMKDEVWNPPVRHLYCAENARAVVIGGKALPGTAGYSGEREASCPAR